MCFISLSNTEEQVHVRYLCELCRGGGGIYEETTDIYIVPEESFLELKWCYVAFENTLKLRILIFTILMFYNSINKLFSIQS